MNALMLFLVLLISSAFILHSFKSSGLKLSSLFLVSVVHLYLGGSFFITLMDWLLLGGAAFITFNHAFRQETIADFFYEFIKKQLPPISETERTALEAGDSTFEADIFRGDADYQAKYSLNEKNLNEAEQLFIDQKVTKLCEMLNEWEINTHLFDLPKPVWDYIKKEGFFGLEIPTEYQGHGFSALAHSSIVAKIASVSATAAVTVMVPNSLGPAELLLHYGTDEQKKHYLPRLAKGQEIPCFGLTSTTAGSDATSIKDKGIICKKQIDGKKRLGILLNFEKRYITLAPVATVIGLAFKLYDPDHLLGDEESLGITLALIPRETKGIQIGGRHYPMQHAFMNGPIVGKDVFIPLDYIIGGQDRIGQGWRMLMECLSVGRGISLPALGNATSKMSYLTSSAYALLREQFGRSIGAFEGINVLLAKLAGQAYLSESQRAMTLATIAQGKKPSLLSAISKLHMTEMGREGINTAFDIHAGKAIQMGPNNYLAWPYMAIPVAITVEGANILTRNLIVFGQGLIRCHPYIKTLVDLVYQEKNEATAVAFDDALFGFVNNTIANLSGVLLNHVTFGWQAKSRFNGSIQAACRKHFLLSCKLALVSDLCLAVLGGQLKVKEAISARLGDALSYLTMHYAAQQYYLNHENSDDALYFEWVSQYCFHETEKSLRTVLDNLPNRMLSRALKVLVFPWGQQFAAPSDLLSNQLGRLAQRDHVFRERIKEQLFLNPVLKELETAFLERLRLNEPYKKLMKAIKSGTIPDDLYLDQQIEEASKLGLLNKEDSEDLNELSKMVLSIMTVDEFKSLQDMVSREIA